MAVRGTRSGIGVNDPETRDLARPHPDIRKLHLSTWLCTQMRHHHYDEDNCRHDSHQSEH